MDCNKVLDMTKTKIIFEYFCPKDMEIVEIIKSKGTERRPCSWEVVYVYKPALQRPCNEENAREAFQDISKLIPQNTEIVDKRIVGTPEKYKVLYKVLSCDCPQLYFEYRKY